MQQHTQQRRLGRGRSGRHGRGRGRQSKDGVDAEGASETDVGLWNCEACTYFNAAWRRRCEMCGTAARSGNGGGTGGGGTGGGGTGGGGGGNARNLRRAQREAGAALLAFTHAPREAAPARTPARRAAAKLPRPVAKMRFLRAHYHLLCPVASGEARASVGWEDCRAARLSTSEEVQCPICLVAPAAAPQVASCGHILCLPCALRLHAAAVDEERVCKCPVCADALHVSELRTVLLLSVREVRAGGVATFRRLPLPAPRRRGGPAPPKVYADVSSVPALVGGTV
ncbi:hypothetical protein EMIHUDRAFT_453928, partial [Emiliania huxleyi CCMP1516]|uniref:RanBP-type and C3HC4-type zinc finger-containing protein 1 n=2 Tax=Emiliania huxleyi TaxID=2903 RepID=A0A0D3HZ02_EMIH1